MSVFTTISKNQLVPFLRGYSHASLLDFKGIEAGITNTNYFVNTSDAALVLTIVEHEQAEDVEWFMELLAYLNTQGIPCAKPVRSLAGHYTSQLYDKPATLVERLSGADCENVKDRHCHEAGQTLADMHIAGQDFKNQRTDSRGRDWRITTASQVYPHVSADGQRWLDKLCLQPNQTADQLESLPASVIHADLFRDNVLFDGDRISGIIDFYYACNGCMLYDAAIAFNDWCRHQSGVTEPTRSQAFLNGYTSRRPFTAEEKHAWPLAVQTAALRFWLSRLQDLHFPPEGEMTNTKDPDIFLKILQQPVAPLL